MSDLLEFNKERTMGQIITFAFVIYRKNAKNFWKGMFIGVFPWILGAGICFTPFFIQYGSGSAFNWDSFVFLLLLAIALYMFGFLVLNTYVNEYIIAMKNDTVNQKPHFKGILKATYKAVPANILNFFLLTILFMLMSMVVMGVVYIFSLIMFVGVATGSVIIIGLGYILYMVAYFIAFSYLSICTGPIIFIGQYEKVGFFKALEINFSYVHGKKSFWSGILVSLFGFLLMYVISFNISQPITIVYGVIKYNSSGFGDGSSAALTIIGIIYLTIAVTWPISSFIMMMIFGANYFNQKERSMGTGLMHKINRIKGLRLIRIRSRFLMKYVITILMFVFAFNMASAGVLRDDTTQVEVRKFDEEKINEYQKNPRYDYHTRESWLKKMWRKLIEWIGRLTGKRYQDAAKYSRGGDVLYAIIGIAALVLIIFALSKTKFRSWITGKGATIVQEYEVEEENIHEIEFDKDIKDAEAAADYRRAVRLRFLKVLKNLSDNGLIYWDPNKTNHQYIYEVKGTDIHTRFVKCVNIFDNVWYGEYPIDVHYYNNNKSLFEELAKGELKVKTAVFNG